MGQQHHEKERLEDLEGLARECALEAGAIERCELHPEDFVSISAKWDDAYELGDRWVEQQRVDADKQEFRRILDTVFEQANHRCPLMAPPRD